MTFAFITRTAPSAIVRTLTLVVLAALASIPAAAQDVEPAGAGGNADSSISSLIQWQTEYQDNVFRTPDQAAIADIVSTLTGSGSARAQMRRLRVVANGTADWVHYDSLVDERGANGSGSLRANLVLNRVTPYASTTYRNSRNRRNTEIDIRPRITSTSFLAGTVFQLGGKTVVDASAEHRIEGYHRTIVVDGVNLSEALDRASDQLTVSLQHGVTPLTRLTVTGELMQQEFDSASYKNADQARLTAGFESDGRIRGHARGGIQMVKPHDPALQELRGLFISVGTNATVHDRLQLGVDAERDLAPSYRAGIAYYDSKSIGGSVRYAMLRSLRLGLTAERRLADYEAGIGIIQAAVEDAGIDRETHYQSVISYLLGQAMAIDVSASHTERTSNSALRRFDSTTFMVGVSHAF